MVEHVHEEWLPWATALKQNRELAGMTQTQLARAANMSRQVVSKYEMATRAPKSDIASKFDGHLSTGGALWQLWQDMSHAAEIPEEWRDFIKLERAAKEIWEYQPLLIPGLLQCETYIRWVMRRECDNHGAPEQSIKVRADRIRNLRPGAILRVIMDEGVLRRVAGDEHVMREQLEHVLWLAESSSVVPLVLPTQAPWRPAIAGAFRIMTLEGGRQVVHADHARGQAVIQKPNEVTEMVGVFGELCSESLSQSESIRLIERIRKETHG
ncbi:helix-turn-helix domain-containing protein [Streptomonospora salina]|uniref:Transcriptional regulator with XRE-family HTH domain n=1 Tax=Streptomonospora salina TaxID=104205 RepID=A0A841ECH1_9ACTN|nr:helix-turn-helix transcriptional regulator [Streptomonospora salina]MBB5999019.1 transcriptional regulator with XRE-family HTH domain [Streptomonospora salina]